MAKAIYLSSRPELTIERKGGKNLGNCYSARYYKITSRHPLSVEDLKYLREAGLLGYGQQFVCVYKNNQGGLEPVPEFLTWQFMGNVVPTGFDEVPCVDTNDITGEIVCSPAINPYTNQPYPPTNQPYYIYMVEDHVDSSG